MGAISKRVYTELLDARESLDRLRLENTRLRHENGRLVHQVRLAYLEGLDQGRAELEALEACG